MFCSNPCLLMRRAQHYRLSPKRRSLLKQCWHCWSQLASQKNHATFPKLEFAGFYRILPVFYRIFVGFWVKLPSRLLKNTRGCFTMREEVAESYMLNGNGVQNEVFLTQQNSLIMPEINLNLQRKLASLVTLVNSRWFWALNKNFVRLKNFPRLRSLPYNK